MWKVQNMSQAMSQGMVKGKDIMEEILDVVSETVLPRDPLTLGIATTTFVVINAVPSLGGLHRAIDDHLKGFLETHAKLNDTKTNALARATIYTLSRWIIHKYLLNATSGEKSRDYEVLKKVVDGVFLTPLVWQSIVNIITGKEKSANKQ